MRSRHTKLGEPVGLHLDIRAVHRTNDTTRMDQSHSHSTHARLAHERDIGSEWHVVVIVVASKRCQQQIKRQCSNNKRQQQRTLVVFIQWHKSCATTIESTNINKLAINIVVIISNITAAYKIIVVTSFIYII